MNDAPLQVIRPELLTAGFKLVQEQSLEVTDDVSIIEALGKPVIALSRLAILAAQAGADGPVQAWIDAGRGDVFVGRYVDGACVAETMMAGEDAAAELGEGSVAVCMEDSLTRLYPGLRLVAAGGVRKAVPLAAAAAIRGDFADTALLDANYLRVPDAALALQARRGAATHSG